jgi:hypothetical protein
MKIPSLLAGVAGEYFVAAELSRRGHIASISLRNTRGIDILATNKEASRSITIQCKTNQNGKTAWVLNEKSETLVSKTHFYVFVAFRGVVDRPAFHIVPSSIVAKHIRTRHSTWLRTPGREGRKHVDSPMRKFSVSDDRYLDRWDVLKL